MRRVTIAGAGLAGSAAALAVLKRGEAVRMFDPGRLPRHKVCGEFFTPEVAGILDSLGLWEAFAAYGPARMERVRLVFGARECGARLPEPAFGLSRYRMDALLRSEAERRGAQWLVERAPEGTDIWAVGRPGGGRRGERVFGFKAHFSGAVTDAVELYFDRGFYVGVNPVEGGVTNVCGLGPERALQRIGFDYDSLLWGQAALRERMEGLRRATEWLSVGPLVFHNRFQPRVPDQLVAGDALQFVDPFTGSGMAAALYGGAMAGIWAAESRPVSAFFRQMEQALGRQYLVSGVLRRLVGPAAASGAAAWIPPAWLFRLTRPSFSGL